MVGMNNIPAWVSAGAAALSFIFTVVSWYLSNKSKKAKEKAEAAHQATLETCAAAQRSAQAAEERVQQVEKLLEQMQQIVVEQQSQSQSQSEIAANLYRPIFELTHDGGIWFKLRNTTKNSIEIIEVANANKFTICDFEELPRVLKPNEEITIFLECVAAVTNLELRIDGQDDSVFIPLRYSFKQ